MDTRSSKKTPRRRMRRGSSRVLTLADGRQLGYAEYGDPHGLPLLALHGTPGSRFMFALGDARARASAAFSLIAPETARATDCPTTLPGPRPLRASRLRISAPSPMPMGSAASPSSESPGARPFAVAAAASTPDSRRACSRSSARSVRARRSRRTAPDSPGRPDAPVSGVLARAGHRPTRPLLPAVCASLVHRVAGHAPIAG